MPKACFFASPQAATRTWCPRLGSMRSNRATFPHRKKPAARPDGFRLPADAFTKTDSWLVRRSGKRPRSRQIARFRPRLRLLKCIDVRITRVRKGADLARPIRRDEGRLRWDLPTKLPVRLFHEFCIERILVV